MTSERRQARRPKSTKPFSSIFLKYAVLGGPPNASEAVLTHRIDSNVGAYVSAPRFCGGLWQPLLHFFPAMALHRRDEITHRGYGS